MGRLVVLANIQPRMKVDETWRDWVETTIPFRLKCNYAWSGGVYSYHRRNHLRRGSKYFRLLSWKSCWNTFCMQLFQIFAKSSHGPWRTDTCLLWICNWITNELCAASKICSFIGAYAHLLTAGELSCLVGSQPLYFLHFLTPPVPSLSFLPFEIQKNPIASNDNWSIWFAFCSNSDLKEEGFVFAV